MNYLQVIAKEIEARVPAAQVPDQNTDRLFLAYALLLQAKGQNVTDEDVHDAWAAWMTDIDPSHQALVPFGDLPGDVKQEDSVFVQAIRQAALART